MMIVVRVRGRIGLNQSVKDTFQMLRVLKSHSAVIVPDNPVYKGMINKVKDFIIYGPISEEVLKQLLIKRLTRKDKKKVDDKLVAEVMKSLKTGKLLKDVKEVNPVLRLHPPIKGFKGLKKTVKQGGDLGFHESMDDLIKRMM